MGIIERNVGIIATAGIFVGLFGGSYLSFMENFVVLGLCLVLVIAFLKIEFKDVTHSLTNSLWPVIFSVLKLIVAPLLVFFLTSFFLREYQIGFILLAATPAAMATSSLLLIFGGDAKIGLIVSVLTNLFAPFILPFILFFTLGKEIEIDVFSMLSFLLLIIFVPLLASLLIKRVSTKLTNLIKARSTAITALIFFLFNIGIVAPFSHYIFSDLKNSLLAFLAVVFLSFFFHLMAFVINFRSGKKTLLVSIIVLAYFNTGLSVVLAKQYFGPETVLLTVMYEFVWNIGLIPLQMFFAKKPEALYNPAAN